VKVPCAGFGLTDVCGTEVVAPCNTTEIDSIFPPINGRCNNINFPILGTPARPSRRLLQPCIRDIVNTRDTLLVSGRQDADIKSLESTRACGTNPSTVVNPDFPLTCPSTVLPNPRLVSRTFHTDSDVPEPTVNQLFTMFGQFLDHDLTLTPGVALPSGKNCCHPDIVNNQNLCLNIFVPSNDSFFPTGKCLAFTRSAKFCSAAPNNCNDDNIAALTAYIDANTVYGQDSATLLTLRERVGGRLLTSAGNLLPRIPPTGPFKAGENRARENPALSTLHTLFLREHNRIAGLVAGRNPTFSDETIFANTRRIVIAEIQSIVFGEFLPLLIGNQNEKHGARGDSSGGQSGAGSSKTSYNPNIDPSIINEFATAAYRFGHTVINGQFNKIDPFSGNLLSSYLLRFSNNNEDLYSNFNATDGLGMTSIAKGMTTQSAQTFDNFVTGELTNFLYAASADNFLFGSDLAARNIQRGRDNNIGGWANYRRFCSKNGPNSWNDRPSDISRAKWNILKTLYTDVNDIDLFTGLLAERPVKGAVLGQTAKCIAERQFANIISGDRYFFSHRNGASNFTNRQIKDLQSVKMFDILCLNTNILQVQKRAFENIGGSNRIVNCSQAQGIDISNFF